MNKSEIEKIIKEDVTSKTPDILSKINLMSITIKEPTKESWLRRLKKYFAYTGVLVSVTTVTIILVVSLLVPDSPPSPLPKPIAFNQKEEVYTLSALSAASLLHHSLENIQASSEVNYTSLSFYQKIPSQTSRSIDSHIDTLNQYVHFIEPLVGNKEAMTFQSVPSERLLYEHKLLYSSLDLTKKKVHYTLYYNENEYNDKHLEIDGIMVIDNMEYILEGELEVVGTETELSLYAYDPSNQDTYVHVNQEVMLDEQKFIFEFVENDVIVYASEFSVEIEDHKIKVELVYESNNEEILFKIERRLGNEFDHFYIEYELENESTDEEGVILIEIINEAGILAYRYTITQGDESVYYDKNRYDDSVDDEEDDDDEDLDDDDYESDEEIEDELEEELEDL